MIVTIETVTGQNWGLLKLGRWVRRDLAEGLLFPCPGRSLFMAFRIILGPRGSAGLPTTCQSLLLRTVT